VTVGAFASASRLFDIYCICWRSAFGRVFPAPGRGYQMARSCFGRLLGGLLDKSLRSSRGAFNGSIEPFFTRPISLGFAT